MRWHLICCNLMCLHGASCMLRVQTCPLIASPHPLRSCLFLPLCRARPSCSSHADAVCERCRVQYISCPSSHQSHDQPLKPATLQTNYILPSHSPHRITRPLTTPLFWMLPCLPANRSLLLRRHHVCACRCLSVSSVYPVLPLSLQAKSILVCLCVPLAVFQDISNNNQACSNTPLPSRPGF